MKSTGPPAALSPRGAAARSRRPPRSDVVLSPRSSRRPRPALPTRFFPRPSRFALGIVRPAGSPDGSGERGFLPTASTAALGGVAGWLIAPDAVLCGGRTRRREHRCGTEDRPRRDENVLVGSVANRSSKTEGVVIGFFAFFQGRRAAEGADDPVSASGGCDGGGGGAEQDVSGPTIRDLVCASRAWRGQTPRRRRRPRHRA